MNKWILEKKIKKIKQSLCIMITLIMVFSLSISVCAESAKRNEEDFAIKKVNATSLMIGTDKGFEGDKELTRAEVITVMVRMKGISEETIKKFETKDGEEPIFKDVPRGHWANPYVNVAFNLGLTEGVGDGLFNPSAPVTVSEIYALAVRTLNAGKLVDSERKDYSDEDWFIPYLNFSNEHHISDNVIKLYSDICNRKTCAIIVSNTLDQFLWESSSVTSGNSHKELPEVTFTESDEKLIDRLGFLEASGITINEVDTKDKKIKTSERIDGKNTFEGSNSLDLSTIKRGIKYTLWFDQRSGSTNKDKLTGFFEEVSSSDVVYFKDIKKIGTNYITVLEKETDDENNIEDKEKELKLNAVMNRDDLSKFDFDLYWNDIKQSTYSKLSENSSLSGYLIKDSDGKISKMYIEDFNYFGVIKEITDKRITFETKSKVKGTISETITLSEDNEVIFTELKVGDGVMFHKERRSDLYSGSSSGWRYTLRKLTSHSGRIRSVSTENKTINGVKVQSFTLLGDYENGIWKLDSRIDDYKVKAGDEGTFFLSENGEIVLFAPYSQSSGGFVFITGTRKLRPVYVGDDPTYEVKVTTMDGKVSDWLELDFEKSARNLLGLKEWTLTEDMCVQDDPDQMYWVLHNSDDWTTNDVSISWEAWNRLNLAQEGKVYVLDRWLWDEEVPYLIFPDYSCNGITDLIYNYYIFEKKEFAEKASEKILRKFLDGEVDADKSLHYFLTGKPFKASISGKKITLQSLTSEFEEEWIDFNSPVLPTSSIKLISAFTNGKKYDTVRDVNDNTYYLSDDAKVFLASWNGETGSDMQISLKEADRENLESIKMEDYFDPIFEEAIDGNAPLYAFALGADDDEREVSFIIIPERIASKKTDTELWALLLSTGDSVSDKEETGSDNKNIDSFAEVVFEKATSPRTLYFDSSKFTGQSADFASLKGDYLNSPRLFKFDLEGAEIKKARGMNPNEDSYFSDPEENKPGLLSYNKGILTKIISDSRVTFSSNYEAAKLEGQTYTPAGFEFKDEHYFLSDSLIIIEKIEGSDSYKILDSIHDLKEIYIDTETIPNADTINELNETNLKEYSDNELTFITLNKNGDVEVLAIIKG